MTQIVTLAQASGAGDADLEPHRIHAALYRPILLAGVEPAVVIMEVTTSFALVFGVGLHIATVLLALFYLTVVHSVMVWVATQDALMIGLYVRSVGARDFYHAHAGLHRAVAVVHPSIPPHR